MTLLLRTDDVRHSALIDCNRLEVKIILKAVLLETKGKESYVPPCLPPTSCIWPIDLFGLAFIVFKQQQPKIGFVDVGDFI